MDQGRSLKKVFESKSEDDLERDGWKMYRTICGRRRLRDGNSRQSIGKKRLP